MAKKRTTKTTKTRNTTNRAPFSLSRFSFWLVVIIGIAMLVAGVFNIFDFDWVRSVSSWVMSICFALAMFVPVALSYNTARTKGTQWFVLWIILVIVVVFGLVSTLVGLLR